MKKQTTKKRIERLEGELEWALGRLDHIFFIHAFPKSVEAGFGIGETLMAIMTRLPQLERDWPFFKSHSLEARKAFLKTKKKR